MAWLGATAPRSRRLLACALGFSSCSMASGFSLGPMSSHALTPVKVPQPEVCSVVESVWGNPTFVIGGVGRGPTTMPPTPPQRTATDNEERD